MACGARNPRPSSLNSATMPKSFGGEGRFLTGASVQEMTLPSREAAKRRREYRDSPARIDLGFLSKGSLLGRRR
jgi:hypothetical protein